MCRRRSKAAASRRRWWPTALAHARREGLRVRPDCSYVAAYMQRHPQTLDLLAP